MKEIQKMSGCCGAKEHEYAEGICSMCGDRAAFAYYDEDGNEVDEEE